MFVWLRTNTYHITGGFLLEAEATVVHLHSRWFSKRLPYQKNLFQICKSNLKEKMITYFVFLDFIGGSSPSD